MKPTYGMPPNLPAAPVATPQAAPVRPNAKAPSVAPSERGHVTHNPANALPASAQHAKGTRAKMNKGRFY
jgi:hypothetical protein